MQKDKYMRGLSQLTSAAFEASQFKMGALVRHEAELREMIASLEKARQHAPDDAQLTDPARRAGADLLWQRWVDTRRSSLNMELVNNLVAQAHAKTALAKDFGRNEAVRGLKERQEILARAEASRRAERRGF